MLSIRLQIAPLIEGLTEENFHSVSEAVAALCNIADEQLINDHIIEPIYDAATRNKDSFDIYARLCRKVMQQINGEVQHKVINSKGEPISLTGVQLFRKCLLDRCQLGFLAACSPMDLVISDHRKERLRYTVMRFICELFRLQMMPVRAMHRSLKALLRSNNPENHRMQMVCIILVFTGKILDTPDAKAHMDVYFIRIKEFSTSQELSPRIRSMLQYVIRLRERKWARCDADAAPSV